MTNEINRMTKDKAREILERGGSLCWEGFYWNDYEFYCGCNDKEYTCCYSSFGTIEDMLDHLESMCEDRWEEVV